MSHRFLSFAAISITITVGLTALTGCCCPCFTTYNDLQKLVPTGSASGTVLADEPKETVPGARVTIADRSTTTDAQGKFKLTKVVATNQTITVTSSGFQGRPNADRPFHAADRREMENRGDRNRLELLVLGLLELIQGVLQPL